jgi:chromosome segregation ATPase
MIYLIMKIFLYLFIALIVGLGAGWLIRNIAATRKEDELNKLITEVRARVPQFESLMRTRDEQAQKLRADLKSQEAKQTELQSTLKLRELELRDRTRELSALTARNAALEGTGDSQDMMDVDLLPGGAEKTADTALDSNQAETIGALLDDIERLRTELAEAKTHAAAQVESMRSQVAESATAEEAGANESLLKEVQELQARLRQKAQEQEQLNKKLETEQRKLIELERERELQNKSLQVLHQQLELERERNQKTANA